MPLIRLCHHDERPAVLSIINMAAEAYRGVIPADRWHEPYMSAGELDREIAAGVTFWGYDEGHGTLAGIMGFQPVRNVDLIRHAYVLPGKQRRGIGRKLLEHLRQASTRPLLVGTWAGHPLLRTTWLCSGLTGAQDHTPDDLLEYPGAASRDFGRARLFARRSRVLKARELPPKNSSRYR